MWKFFRLAPSVGWIPEMLGAVYLALIRKHMIIDILEYGNTEHMFVNVVYVLLKKDIV